MSEKASHPAVIPFEDTPADLDLSPWTGRLEPPAATAADARIAQVTDLRRIRDDKLYLSATQTWEEFCERHLLISRRSIDRNIRRLREFGPAFFHASDAAPLSSHEFRMIREHTCAEGVRYEGALVPFGEPNRRRLAAAIAELLYRAGPKPVQPRAESFARVAAHLESAARSLDGYGRALDRLQKLEISALVGRLSRRALDLGVHPA